MLRNEAKWLGNLLSTLAPKIVSPMLNIGASTERFRSETQPWINEFVIGPATRRGIRFIHSDIKSADGIDIVGDLTDPGFLETLSEMRLGSILCTNLLEHVENQALICRALESIVRPGGLLIITVPYRYPHHPDPIDTGFRPTPDELSALFPECAMHESAILPCGTYLGQLLANPPLLVRTLLRLGVPFYKPRS